MYFDISKKSKYAILALFELALRGTQSPLNARKLARGQNLPVRFLEVILNELKQGGFVHSVRGKAGGYVLARPATKITVGQILGFLETKNPESIFENDASSMPGQIAVSSLLKQANEAIGQILERSTLDDLVQDELSQRGVLEGNYII